MKVKTMRTIIRKAVGDWLKSIKDENVRQMANRSVMVTGGSIASMLRGENVNDFDLYFTSRAAVVAIADYYVKQHHKHVDILYGERKDIYIDNAMSDYNMDTWDPRKSYRTMIIENLEEDRVALDFNGAAGYAVPFNEELGREQYSPLFFSENAITLTNQIQLILRFHGEPAKIHENFDFLHATNYYLYGSDEFVWNSDAILAATTGELKYVGSKYPLTSIIRIKKFLARGYAINAGEQLKIMFQLSLLDLTDPLVLSNQLVGVDIAYFTILINELIKETNADPSFGVTSGWLNDRLDKIFNYIAHDED